MRRAFVSHSTADDSFVAEMESFLRAAGFDDVFNDVHAVRPDEKFWPRIKQGITDCDTFLVVITVAAANSEWVKREVELARRLSKRIIPVWREDCPLPLGFSDRDVIDFRPQVRKERRFDISRILKYAPAELIGREDETRLLADAWQKTLRLEKGRPHVLTFIALGGEGKTALVAKWAAELAGQDWPGCYAAFAWSFYSQGTSEQQAASSDLFLKEALGFFAAGDEEEDEIRAFAASPAGAFEKGQRLARLVGQRRSLLILDGLEPLQYSPASPTPGELKDQGVAALLKGLAAANPGLCVVTTRYSLPDLKAFWQTTGPEVKLLRLSRDAGVHLLKSLGVTGTAQEFDKLVEDVKGHALTLTLLGGFLKRVFHGDIRQRDRVKFEKADEKMDGGHAFRTLAAYEQWLLRDGGEEGRREVAVLRLTGLFDRPVDAGCLHALLQPPVIPGLTEPLVGLAEDDWETCLSGLETALLVTVNRDAAGALTSLDAHPHIREYFAKQVRKGARWSHFLRKALHSVFPRAAVSTRAWRAAHRRSYEHLCATTTDKKPNPTLEDLQPLYQAVAHGCQAGLQQKACDDVVFVRIRRRNEDYTVRKLGAFASDLGAIACFFEQPWHRVSQALADADRAWSLGQAAFYLRALGRLTESLEPMRAGLKDLIKQHDWERAAVQAANLSGLELTLGDVAGAVGDAEQSVTYARRSGDAFQRCLRRTTVGDALHQAGRRAEAETCFREAEQMQQEMQPDYPLLYSVRGFKYCDLLLAASERTAWQKMQEPGVRSQESGLVEVCHAVSQRAAQTLKWTQEYSDAPLLDVALGHLTAGRAALYRTILENSELRPLTSDLFHIDAAVAGLRRAGQQDELPDGLLTSAWQRYLTGALTGPESAQTDLDEAWEIAERGPMRLFLADIHLHRARLFFREPTYPWESPSADLAAARKLIEQCGYWRRKEELEDAEDKLGQQPS